MPFLTVTEKEHWKDRIARRIDKKIETLAARNANLLERVANDARARALRSLGFSDLQAELDTIEEQRDTLERRERQAQRAMLAMVRGVPADTVDLGYHHGFSHEVDNAIERRQAVHEDEILAEDPIGQQILRLRQEKDELLDTVWLATSPHQLRELWQKVVDLLEEEPTPLQRGAMSITPAVED